MIVVTEVEKKVDKKKYFFIKEKAYLILIHTKVLKRQTQTNYCLK